MKVLHTAINGEIAGGQKVCLQIMEALLEEGHQAIVVSPNEGPFTELVRKKGIPVFQIPFEKTYSFHRAFQLARLIKKEKVNLVHTHGMVPGNIQARFAACLGGVPCISHIHIANVFNSNPLIRKYQVFLDNWTSKFCYRLIAVSQSTKKSLVDQGIPAERIVVIPNGIDWHEIRARQTREEIISRFNLDTKSRLIGTIGRLCPAKGQEEFLKAAKAVSKKISNAVWFVIGQDMEFSGRYETHLRALARKLDLNGRVIFTGYQADPYSLMNALDLFVLASKAEGMPLVILEAMALKKAVIATAVGGVPEVVQNGRTGILIPPGDSEALIQAMLELLRNPKPVLEMGEAGFQRIRNHFSVSGMIRRVRKIYEALDHPGLDVDKPSNT